MGEAMRKQKGFEEALDLYRQAVEVCENNHCPCNAVVYSNIARTWLALGEPEKSRQEFYRAEEIYDESFTLMGRSMNKGYVSILEAEAGNRTKARELLWEARESAGQLASPYTMGLLYLNQAELKERFPEMSCDMLKESPHQYREKAAACLEKIPGAYEIEEVHMK